MRILCYKVAKLIGGHAVVLEDVIDNVDAQARFLVLEALVRGAGIVDLVEIAIFNRDVLAVFPNFDTVAETDPLDSVPNTATDKAEIAVLYHNALDERLSVNMDAAVFTAHIVDVYISFTGNQAAMTEHRLPFDMSVVSGGVAVGIRHIRSWAEQRFPAERICRRCRSPCRCSATCPVRSNPRIPMRERRRLRHFHR